MTTNNIYLIPKSLYCPECNTNLGSPYQFAKLDKLWCPKCEVLRDSKEFGKQIGMIKDVKI